MVSTTGLLLALLSLLSRSNAYSPSLRSIRTSTSTTRTNAEVKDQIDPRKYGYSARVVRPSATESKTTAAASITPAAVPTASVAVSVVLPEPIVAVPVAIPKTEIAEDTGLLGAAQVGFDILFNRMKEGDDFKQALADAMAGASYNVLDANHKIDALIDSAPCVVFSWTVSPFSTKAKKLLDKMGCQYKAVELNQPWSEGNPIRAALGRRVGRTSVPMVFVGGNYVGGCDDGPSEDCPGLLPLVIQGKLRPLLIEAGALTPDDSVDFVPPYVRRQMTSKLAASKENQRPLSSIKSSMSTTTGAKQETHHDAVEEEDDGCPSDGCELP